MRFILCSSALLFLSACGSDPVATNDVPTTDAPLSDARADVFDAATDVPATDVPATDVPATDVPATDVPAGDVPAGDVPATDVPATDVTEPSDGCAPLSIDGSAIGNDCARDTCPTGYQCVAFSGIVLQMRCQVPCRTDCDCPGAFACRPVTDKAGTRDLCVRR